MARLDYLAAATLLARSGGIRLICPRDHAELIVEHEHGIELDRCPECNGRWLDHDELEQLEATVRSTQDQRMATIEYAGRDSSLSCPRCAGPMRAFNYRAYDLELDACEEQHGFWLDAGEEGRVRDIIAERVRGLKRAERAQSGWGGFLGGLRGDGRGGSIWDRLFGGR
jgi:Zn-finger nucleic acid-binding protein